MCLDSDNLKLLDPPEEGEGIKFFYAHKKRNGKLHYSGQYFLPRGVVYYEEGVWYDADGDDSLRDINRIYAGDNRFYPTGFHIYMKPGIPQEEADLVRRRVKYRKAVVRGTRQGIPCIVAKEMMIVRTRSRGKFQGKVKR